MNAERQENLRHLLRKLSSACQGHDIADALECMEILKADMVEQARRTVFGYIEREPVQADKDKH